MYIGFCKIKLNIPYCHSLKEKRQILKPLFNSLNKNFNIAIAETENHNFWQSTEIGIVTVNNDKIFCQKILASIINYIIEIQGNIIVVDHHQEIIKV